MAPPTQPQSNPIDQAIDNGRKALDAVFDSATRANLPDTARAASGLARALADTNQNVRKLDTAMQNLEKAAPGTTEAVKEVSTALKTLSDLVPIQAVPNGLKPLANDAKAATDSFQKFATSYDAYQKAPDFAVFSPSTWGAKTGAAATAVKDWSSFKTDYQQLETHLPKPLRDPALQKGVGDAVKAGLDVLDALIK